MTVVKKTKIGSMLRDDKNRLFNTSVTPQQIADIAKLVEETSINRNTARDLFNNCIKTGESPIKLMQNN